MTAALRMLFSWVEKLLCQIFVCAVGWWLWVFLFHVFFFSFVVLLFEICVFN